MNDNILDLTSLEIPKGTIKLPSGDIIVTAPTTLGLIKLYGVLKKLTRLEENSTDEEKIEQELKDFFTAIEEQIPQIKGLNLPIDYLVQIIKFVMNLATPAQSKELERRGITVDATESKKNSD